MFLVSYLVNILLGVTTNLHILSLVLCHHLIESEKQVQIGWFGTFRRAPIVPLQARSEVVFKGPCQDSWNIPSMLAAIRSSP